MARTPSTMLPLGTTAPSFNLPDTEGRLRDLLEFRGAHGLVVMFISNHCPFVIHLKEALTQFAHDYTDRISVVAIASNDVENYPQDGPVQMALDKAKYGYPFPYLFDESQEVAKSYEAACTPDFYLFDSELRLVYRGQFDGSRPGNDVAVTGMDLRQACEDLIAGRPFTETDQKPSLGCNIKWKVGSAPGYYAG